MLPRAFHFQRPETKWWTSFGEYCCSGRVVAWDSKSGLPPCESTYMLTCLHAHMLTCIQHTCIRAYMQTCVHVRACMYGCIHTSARFKVLWQRIEPNPFSGRKHPSFIIRPDVKLPFLCEGAQQVRWRHRHDGWKAANDVHNLHEVCRHTPDYPNIVPAVSGMKILQKVGRFRYRWLMIIQWKAVVNLRHRPVLVLLQLEAHAIGFQFECFYPLDTRRLGVF